MSKVCASVANKRAKNDASFIVATMQTQFYAQIPHVNMRLFEKNTKT